MKKGLVFRAFVGTAVIFSMMSGGMVSHCATVDDVVTAARAYGYPEDTIQNALNKYYEDPSLYTSEDMDMAIQKIEEAGQQTISPVPYNPDAEVPTQEQQNVSNENPVTETGGEGNSEVAAPQTEEEVSDGITLTMPDGTQFERVSEEEFKNYSYEERLNYLSSFPTEQQQVIIDNLSPDEYKVIMQQLPAEQKMEVINGFSEATEKLGVNITVDDISDGSMELSMRDEEGNLVGISKAGQMAENTGYDRRGIFAVSGSLILSAILGAVYMISKYFGHRRSVEK